MKTKILFIVYWVLVFVLNLCTKFTFYLETVVTKIETKLPELTDKEIQEYNKKFSE